MTSRYEEFSHFGSGFQAVLLTVGAIVGGFWTGFVYSDSHQQEIASAELDRRLLETKQLQSQAQRAFAEVGLTTERLGPGGEPQCLVRVGVTVVNAGNREIRVGFQEPPLQMAEVHLRRGGLEAAQADDLRIATIPRDGYGLVSVPYATLKPGERAAYPFVVHMRRDSLYLLQFSIPVDTVAPDDSTKAAGARETPWWTHIFERGLGRRNTVIRAAASTKDTNPQEYWVSRKLVLGCRPEEDTGRERLVSAAPAAGDR